MFGSLGRPILSAAKAQKICDRKLRKKQLLFQIQKGESNHIHGIVTATAPANISAKELCCFFAFEGRQVSVAFGCSDFPQFLVEVLPPRLEHPNHFVTVQY